SAHTEVHPLPPTRTPQGCRERGMRRSQAVPPTPLRFVGDYSLRIELNNKEGQSLKLETRNLRRLAGVRARCRNPELARDLDLSLLHSRIPPVHTHRHPHKLQDDEAELKRMQRHPSQDRRPDRVQPVIKRSPRIHLVQLMSDISDQYE